jgi:thioesterase domain-containing protein
MAGVLGRKDWSSPWAWLVPIQTHGSKIPYFQVHGTLNIVQHLEPDQPFYQIAALGANLEMRPIYQTTEEKAAEYLREIRMVHPRGPYLLGGFSYGGLLAIEMAQQLVRQGEQVPLLFLLDPTLPRNYRAMTSGHATQRERSIFPASWGRFAFKLKRMANLGPRESLDLVMNRIRSRTTIFIKLQVCRTCLAMGRSLPEWLKKFYVFRLYHQAVREYSARPYPGPVVLFHTLKDPESVEWKGLFTGELEIHHLSGRHFDLVQEAHIRIWAQRLNACLQRVHETKTHGPGMIHGRVPNCDAQDPGDVAIRNPS